jgi:hypothetical protein
MGEVNATIYLKEGEPEKGWAYTHWVLDVGKDHGAVREDVQIVCAENSQRYMSREEAMQEAKARITFKIQKECGALPESQVRWAVKRST